MKATKPELDSGSSTTDSPSKRIPAWARAPIFMYLSMVAAFAVAGIFVVYYVMRISRSGR
jgi:hypothetical protein